MERKVAKKDEKIKQVKKVAKTKSQTKSPKTVKLAEYNHLAIEPKWQKNWEKNGTYKTTDEKNSKNQKPKKYVLDMFPYPSGQGLHVGHPRGYIASDVFARFQRMKGFNVLHPMGFDSFGLPAEQYAIKTGNNPKTFTDQLIKRYKKQLSIIGLGYDWSREIATHTPKFYKWTQWIFLKLYESWYDNSQKKARPISELVAEFAKNGNEKIDAVCDANFVDEKFSAQKWNELLENDREKILMKYRLAYEGFGEVNWSEDLGTVLANDEIVQDENGKPVSERGGFPVVKKSLRQWFLRITAYADKLLDGLENLDWSPHIKEIQKNWIGKSEGSEIEFEVVDEADNSEK
jgi:leucyl-tRNA synthetase